MLRDLMNKTDSLTWFCHIHKVVISRMDFSLDVQYLYHSSQIFERETRTPLINL